MLTSEKVITAKARTKLSIPKFPSPPSNHSKDTMQTYKRDDTPKSLDVQHPKQPLGAIDVRIKVGVW